MELKTQEYINQNLHNSVESPVCLKIARFTKYPKLSFEKVKTGRSKVLDLLIKNPNENLANICIDQLPEDSCFQVLPNDFYDEAEERFYMSLESNATFSLQIKWTPKLSGNARQVLNFQWEGGQRLQAILLGSAETDPKDKIRKKKIMRKPDQENTLKPDQMNMHLSSPTRKALAPIQSTTPLRRTTFLVNKPSISTVDEEKENNSNNQTRPISESVSPLSFEKQQRPVNTKANIKNRMPTLKDKRESYQSKQNAKRDLFKSNDHEKNPLKANKSGIEINVKNVDGRNKLSHTVQTAKKTTSSMQKGLAMKKLKLTKKGPTTSLPRHPMPYAAKNMFYDERWIEKQDRGFTNWLNFILTPLEEVELNDEDAMKERRETYTIDARKQQAIAPSREDLSFKAYSLRRKMARLRRSACICYHGEDFKFIIHKIEKEVECGMLAVRAEKRIEADLGIKNDILKLMLSYNSLWLRIGLEVIFGEIIMLHSNTDINNLSKFITQRLLNNPDIAKKYVHATVPNLFKTGFEDALSKFTLKKFLMLVLFLDHAKKKRLIEHNPCLFNKDSTVKTSRDLLLIFSRDYLKGEGDLTKHLNYMGFTVTHVQNALDEFDFGVKNLAVDLRDGVRLVRMVELLVNDWSISTKIRLPAVSRLQKVHNVGLALNALRNHGLSIEQDPKAIVDGHREKTLSLLWRIIFHFQVGLLLDIDKLKEELDYLKKIVQLKNDMIYSTFNENFLGLSRRESLENEIYFKSDKLSLLLKWCKLICSCYDVKVDNFTVSFSDGIAFGCIVNFYHPDILPMSLINHETTVTRSVTNQDQGDEDDENDDFLYDNWTKCFSPNTGVNRKLETLLNNEKGNYRVLNQAVEELGGIPWLLKAKDMSNTIPDEKVVITFVSYLCSRLLNIRDETQAARKIQLAWRKYIFEKKRKIFQIQHNAAIVIQRAVREFLHYARWMYREAAAITMQTAWRDYMSSSHIRHKREREYYELCNQAATKIQSCYRGYMARMDFYYMRGCVMLCQAVTKGWLQRRRNVIEYEAATLIQQVYQSYVITSRLRYQFLQCRASARIIQAAYRDYSYRKYVHHSATVIQATWKGYMQRKAFLNIQRSVTVLQSHIKAKYQLKRYTKQREAARCIQEHYRAWRLGRDTRGNYLHMINSAKKIQLFYRTFTLVSSLRTMFVVTRMSVIKIQRWYRTIQNNIRNKNLRNQSAICIQKYWRSYQQCSCTKQEYINLKKATLFIQSRIRGYITRRHFQKQKSSAQVIQQFWRNVTRRRNDRESYISLKESAICIQSYWRMNRCRNDYLKKRSSVFKIQQFYKATCIGAAMRKNYLLKRQSVITIQSLYRGYQQRKSYSQQKNAVNVIKVIWKARNIGQKERFDYLEKRNAVSVLQSMYRTKVIREEFIKQRKSAITIQSCVRGYLQRKELAAKVQSVIKLQSFFRMLEARRNYRLTRNAAIVIQSFVRMFISRTKFTQFTDAVFTIENAYISYQTRKQYLRTRNSIMKIQSFIRMKQELASYVNLKSSVIIIQQMYRSYRCRKNFKALQKSVTKLQALHRMHIERDNFVKQKQCIINLQRIYRMSIQRKCFALYKQSAIKIQSFYRMHKNRTKYQTTRTGIIALQSIYRKHVQQRKYRTMLNSIIKIQSIYRMARQHGHYKKLLRSTLLLQQLYRKRCMKRRNAAIKIQSIWRSYYLFTKYNCMKESVCKISSTWKGYKARTEFNSMKEAVIKIQAFGKMYIYRNQYLQLQNATKVIQRSYRTKTARVEFLNKKSAIIILQSIVKCSFERQRYFKQRQAVITIQSYIRMWREKALYDRKKNAVILIQSFMRMRNQRNVYQKTLTNFVKFQAIYRMYSCRKNYRQQKNAASVIQTCFREYSVKKLNTQVFSATKIQSTFKMYQQLKLLNRQKLAATKIQSWIKMHQCRSLFMKKQQAIIILQANVRWFICRKKNARSVAAAVTIQTFYRKVQAQRKYHQQKYASVKLQSTWKMYSERKLYLRKLHASVVIQHALKSYWNSRKLEEIQNIRIKAVHTIERFWLNTLFNRSYIRQNNSAIKIQSFLRMRYCRSLYINQRNAAIKIQRFIHTRCCRNSFVEKKHNAIRIQSIVRQHMVRKGYCFKLQAAIKLQSTVRGYIARQQYLKVQRSIVRVQSVIRCYLQRKKYMNIKTSAVVIQSYIRGYQQNQHYLQFRSSAMQIQSFYRSHKTRRSFNKKRQSCIIIQRAYRSYNDTKNKEILAREFSVNAIRIQSFYRACKQRQLYLKQKRAACIIQQRYRAYQIGSSEYVQYHFIRGAIVTVQSNTRGFLQRRRYSKLKYSSVIIQSFYKMHLQRSSYQQKKTAVIKIQANFRRYYQQKQFRLLKELVTKLQRSYKERKAQQKILELAKHSKAVSILTGFYKIIQAKSYLTKLRFESRNNEHICNSATIIQSVFRMFLSKKRFTVQRRACIKIQAFVRCSFERKKYLGLKHATLVLQRNVKANFAMKMQRCNYVFYRTNIINMQSIYRMSIERKKYLETRQAVLKIQCWYRCIKEMEMSRNEYLKVRDSCLIIQRTIRNFLKQNKFNENIAATKIASTYKMFRTRKNYQKSYQSILTIQLFWKSYRQRKSYLEIKNSVSIVQHWYRNIKHGQLERSKFIKGKLSVLKIQNAYRTYKQNTVILTSLKALLQHRNAARVIEKYYLVYIKKKKYEKLLELQTNSVRTIQRAYDKYLLAKQQRMKGDAAIKIQNAFRQYQENKKTKEQMEQRKLCLTEFTHASRKCLAVLRMQRWYRNMLVQRVAIKERKIMDNAAKIQALWRGYRVRRTIKDKRVKEARRKISIANANVTEPMKLCNRTRSALDYLLHVKNLSTVHDALQHLDTVTLLSFKCCERLITDNALPVIFRILHYGNRSLPWISIKQVAFSILLNVAKCPTTYRYVYHQDESMNIILEQMANFRDKKAFIFPIACNLITVLCHDEDIKKDILRNKKHIEKITIFYRLNLRKQKLDLKRSQNLKTKEQQYSTTAWHRRASCINSRDPFTAINMLIRRLELSL